MSKAKYSVRVYPLSENHSYVSQIYAGLFDLAEEGVINLEFTWFPKCRIHERNGSYHHVKNQHIFYLEVTGSSGVERKVCYDMMDGPGISSKDGLEACDAYFKRSYNCSTDRLHSAHAKLEIDRLMSKTRPYGLNYPCKSEFEKGRLKCTLITSVATGAYRTQNGLRENFRTLKKMAKTTPNKLFTKLESTQEQHSTFKYSTELEIKPHEPAEQLVLFQTRLFNPKGRADEEVTAKINKTRVETLRALKEAFGDKVIGGLIANEYATKHYPELISKEDVSRENYLKLVSKCLVTVFTRGLVNSNGWRLPEYLSASRCIVSEPLWYELPQPLKNNINCLYFSTPEESVKACNKILDDHLFSQEMRENNYRYYCENVKPSSLILNTLDVAMQV